MLIVHISALQRLSADSKGGFAEGLRWNRIHILYQLWKQKRRATGEFNNNIYMS